jgi:hypothetical protein
LQSSLLFASEAPEVVHSAGFDETWQCLPEAEHASLFRFSLTGQ